MKRILVFFVVMAVASPVARAEFVSAGIKASGLTCSMCSNAIDKALRTLDFVQDVQPDLATTSFAVTFKPGKAVNIEALKDKIEGAGFFVSELKAIFRFDNLGIRNDFHFVYENNDYHFVDVQEQVLNGDVKLTFTGKGYITTKEFKRYSRQSSFACIKSGADCKSSSPVGKVYHVTLQ